MYWLIFKQTFYFLINSNRLSCEEEKLETEKAILGVYNNKNNGTKNKIKKYSS